MFTPVWAQLGLNQRPPDYESHFLGFCCFAISCVLLCKIVIYQLYIRFGFVEIICNFVIKLVSSMANPMANLPNRIKF